MRELFSESERLIGLKPMHHYSFTISEEDHNLSVGTHFFNDAQPELRVADNVTSEKCLGDGVVLLLGLRFFGNLLFPKVCHSHGGFGRFLTRASCYRCFYSGAMAKFVLAPAGFANNPRGAVIYHADNDMRQIHSALGAIGEGISSNARGPIKRFH